MDWTSSNGQYGKPSEFTDSEVSVIKSCLSKTDRFKLLRNGPASNNPKGELISIGLSPYGSWYNKKVKSSLTITKYTDEWFLCQVDDSFYKCDQLEGLSKLIKDTNSINIFVDQFLKEDITLDSEYYESITLDDYCNFIQSNGDKLEVFSKNDVTYLRSGNHFKPRMYGEFKPTYIASNFAINYYHYKKMELKIQINGNIVQSKLHPILDAIYELSKKWYLINNSIDIYQSNQDVEDGVYTVTYKISDTEHVDPDLPRDIAEEIVRDMFRKIDNIGFIEDTTNLNLKNGDTKTFRRMLGSNLMESFIFEISPSYIIFTLKLEK